MKTRKQSRLDKLESHTKMQDEAITWLVGQVRSLQKIADALLESEEVDEPQYPEKE